MTLLALAGEGGDLGASGLVAAAFSSPESATAPNPFPALYNRSRRVMFLGHCHVSEVGQAILPAWRRLIACDLAGYQPRLSACPTQLIHIKELVQVKETARQLDVRRCLRP